MSPVTRKVIEFNEEAFSPGNMYVKQIHKDLLPRYDVGRKVRMMDGRVLPLSQAYKVIFWYRVYGNTGIIRTGTFGIDANGAFSFN